LCSSSPLELNTQYEAQNKDNNPSNEFFENLYILFWNKNYKPTVLAADSSGITSVSE
jgi:hypothetical protein